MSTGTAIKIMQAVMKMVDAKNEAKKYEAKIIAAISELDPKSAKAHETLRELVKLGSHLSEEYLVCLNMCTDEIHTKISVELGV